MIHVSNNIFHLKTNSTSYIFFINELGLTEHLYYGEKISNPDYDLEALRIKQVNKINEVNICESNSFYQMNNIALELSTEFRGDFKTPLVSLSYENNIPTLDLRFQSFKIINGVKRTKDSLNQAIGALTNATTLELEFVDIIAGVLLTSYYTVFSNDDVITRRNVVTNLKEKEIKLKSLYSAQLDLFHKDYKLSTFNGAWARERKEEIRTLSYSKIINESRKAASSAEANPGIILEDINSGECYMTNLIYSAAHREIVEVTSMDLTHVLTGLNPDFFTKTLKKGESFESPEAVLIYAKNKDELITTSHNFIKRYVIRSFNKDKNRPIVFNTWEALYFDVNEKNLYSLVDKTATLGFEVFMLDDGWFGNRNDDKTSLGDWYTNNQKLPNGLFKLSNYVHKNNMKFGLWLEPEMISQETMLYKKNPNWVLKDKRRAAAVGRNQYLLDLTNNEVYAYLYSTISNLIAQNSIDYIKWDMNRHISDIYSSSCNLDSYIHSYIISFTKLQQAISSAFPNIIIENCAAGGTRLDLSTLACSDIIWTSDCSDAFERLDIMKGSASFYPLYALGSSVSEEVNAMTGRKIDLEDRFNVAFFGSLSYSLDLNSLTKEELKTIKNQIEFYKYYRHLIKDGTFKVEEDKNRTIWTLSSKDKDLIIALDAIKLNKINAPYERLKISSVNTSYNYEVFSNDDDFYQVSGVVLKSGFYLKPRSANPLSLISKDFKTKLYVIKKKERK